MTELANVMAIEWSMARACSVLSRLAKLLTNVPRENTAAPRTCVGRTEMHYRLQTTIVPSTDNVHKTHSEFECYPVCGE